MSEFIQRHIGLSESEQSKMLDDLGLSTIEELVREDNTNDAMLHMQQNREAGKKLLLKAEAAIRRASRAASDPHFTNLS